MCSTKSRETWTSLEQEESCSVVARGIQGGEKKVSKLRCPPREGRNEINNQKG